VTDPHAQMTEQDEAAGTETHHQTDGDADHAAEALGPFDVEAWLAAALGVALGLVVALCLVIAVSL
jgi:hypothetical protein